MGRGRRWLNVVARLLCLLFFVGALLLVATTDFTLHRGIVTGTDTPPSWATAATPGNPSLSGINTFLDQDTPDDIRRSLDMIRAAGYGYIRQQFAWERIEPERGVFKNKDKPAEDSWTVYDDIVNEARARGLTVIARLDRPPRWARINKIGEHHLPDTSNGPPDKPAYYADFVRAVANHFKGRIGVYQIWNEPNLQNEWNDERVNAAAYVNDLLKPAFRVLRDVDPQALVMAATLAPTDVNPPFYASQDDLRYTQAMYDAGAKAYFDINSVQLYGLGFAPDYRFLEPDFSLNPDKVKAYHKNETLEQILVRLGLDHDMLANADLKRVNFNRPIAIHDTMAQNGDGSKPVWAAEYGYNSLPADWKGDRSSWGANIDSATQGQWMVEGLERMRREWPWLGVVNVWYFQPQTEWTKSDPTTGLPNADKNPVNGFRLVNPDFSPRPAWTALATYNTQRSRVAVNGYYPADAPAMTFTGNWQPTLVAGNTHPAQSISGNTQSRSSVVVRVASKQLDLRVIAPDGARLYCEVDSDTLSTMSAEDLAKRSYIDVAASTIFTRVTVADNLSDTTHTLRVFITSSQGTPQRDKPVIVVGSYAVQPDPNRTGYVVIYALILLGLLLTGATFVRDFSNSLALDVPVWGRWSGRRVAWGGRGVGRLGRRWVYGTRERVAPVALPLALVLFYLSPNTPLSLLLAAVFVGYVAVRPDSALLLAVASAPLLYHPKLLNGATAFVTVSPDNVSGEVIKGFQLPLAEFVIVATAVVALGKALVPAKLIPHPAPSPVGTGEGNFVKNLSLRLQNLILPSFLGKAALRRVRRDGVRGDRQAMVVLGSSLFTPTGALLLLGVVATLSLLLPYPAYLGDALRDYRRTIVEPLLFYALVVVYMRDLRRARWLVDTLVATAVVVAAVAIYQYLFNGRLVVEAEGVSRAISVYLHPDNVGLFLGRAMPFAAAFGLLERGSVGRRTAYGVALGVILVGTLVSFSRGAWLGEAAALLVIVAMLGSRRLWLAYGAAVLAVAAVLPIIGGNRVASLFSTGGSTGSRLGLWKASLQMLRDGYHWLTGIGMDQFLYLYNPQYVPPSNWSERFTSHPHNIVLDFWLRLGILGLIALAALLGTFGLTLRRLWRVARAPMERALLLGLAGSMADFTVHGLIDNSYFVMDLALVLCLSFALLEAARRRAVADTPGLLVSAEASPDTDVINANEVIQR